MPLGSIALVIFASIFNLKRERAHRSRRAGGLGQESQETTEGSDQMVTRYDEGIG